MNRRTFLESLMFGSAVLAVDPTSLLDISPAPRVLGVDLGVPGGDWSTVVRICNIDISALAEPTNPTRLIDLMTQASQYLDDLAYNGVAAARVLYQRPELASTFDQFTA